jgi:hypothetical protein
MNLRYWGSVHVGEDSEMEGKQSDLVKVIKEEFQRL